MLASLLLVGSTLALATEAPIIAYYENKIATDSCQIPTIAGPPINNFLPLARPVVDASNAPFEVVFHNNYVGDVLYAYIKGNSNNSAKFVTSDGELYDPCGASVEPGVAVDHPTTILQDTIAIRIPSNSTNIKVQIPESLSSGRIYISEGPLAGFARLAGAEIGTCGVTEPSAVAFGGPSYNTRFGFVEFTYTKSTTPGMASQVFVNLSFVDFVSLVLGMSLTGESVNGGVPNSSTGLQTKTIQGLKPNAISNIFNAMESQTAIDGMPWADMCVTDDDGAPLRILSPNSYLSGNDSRTERFAPYYDGYVEKVRRHYQEPNAIRMNTQDGSFIRCTGGPEGADGAYLTCAHPNGTERDLARPTTGEIFSCAGDDATRPFFNGGDGWVLGIVPRLCAAFARSTLLLPDGDVTPSCLVDHTMYYPTVDATPTNHYARIVHHNEHDSLGYAFQYDDVNPVNGADQSGGILGHNPTSLVITVRGCNKTTCHESYEVEDHTAPQK